MEENRFPKAILNYNPRAKRKRERPTDAREIYESGKGNNAQTVE